jgi:hypothetical protein
MDGLGTDRKRASRMERRNRLVCLLRVVVTAPVVTVVGLYLLLLGFSPLLRLKCRGDEDLSVAGKAVHCRPGNEDRSYGCIPPIGRNPWR